MVKLIWFRSAQIAAGFMTSSGLFAGGYSLLQKGIDAKGSLEFKSALISGSISAESAGLAMILVGLVVFLVPFVVRVKVSRDRISLVGVRTRSSGIFISTRRLCRLNAVGSPEIFPSARNVRIDWQLIWVSCVTVKDLTPQKCSGRNCLTVYPLRHRFYRTGEPFVGLNKNRQLS